MSLIKIFTNSYIEDVLRVLRALLDRQPILILGRDEETIENFINELTSLVVFRSVVSFFTDFVSKDEYQQMNENEEIDYDVARNIYICYPFAVPKLIETFTHFKSWIIGFHDENNGNLEDRKSQLLLKKKIFGLLFGNSKVFLEVRLSDKIMQSKFHLHHDEEPNLLLEKMLFNNAIQRTSIAIEKIKRVISKRVKKADITMDVMDDLFDFAVEEVHLKENLLKREIQDFYDASKRAFSLLSRLENLKNLGFTTKISPKTLFDTISYPEIPIERILSFIKSEWNVDFREFFDENKMVKFMDRIESMWG